MFQNLLREQKKKDQEKGVKPVRKEKLNVMVCTSIYIYNIIIIIIVYTNNCYIIESHPSCNNCKRLNLKCVYEVVYRWDEEALQNGTTFGRSNQFKKTLLHNKYENYISNNLKNLDSNNKFISSLSKDKTFDYFLKSETSTLSKKILNKNIPWVNTKNKLYFINTTQHDFIKNKLSYLLENSNSNEQQNISSLPLIQIFSSILMDDFFLNSLKNNDSNNTPLLDYTNYDINLINNNLDNDELDDNELLEILLPSNNNPDIFDELSSTILDDFSLVTDYSFNSSLNIQYSLQNLVLQSNDYYNKFNNLSSEQQSLISFFIDKICPTCVCYSTLKKASLEINPIYFIDESISKTQSDLNPYLYLIVPLAFKHEIVMDAVMATSSYHLYLSGVDKSFENISNFYSNKSIKQLSDLIREKQCLHSSNWDDVLATILMLCFKEISANSDSRNIWMIYLNYAKYLVKVVNSLNITSPLSKFFARYFITHEVMGHTALLDIEENNSKINNSNFINFYLNSIENNYDKEKKEFIKYIIKESIDGDLYLKTLKDKDTSINIVFGCCPYLICLTHQISSLAECYEGLEFETDENKRDFEKQIFHRRKQIKFELENIDQKIQISENINTNKSDEIIKQIAEIRRLSTFLYLFIRIDLEELYQNNGIITKDFIDKRKEMEKIKLKVMELLNSLPEISVTLLWTVFILGVITTNYEHERWFVLDTLTKIQNLRESASLKTAKEVIIDIWKRVDLELTSFRWKTLINEKSETLSIALIN